MAEFQSDKEKKKWASLQNRAGSSIAAIAAGRATHDDFNKVSQILKNLNGLAQQVFDQAVSAAEVQAKKFEQQYEKVKESSLSSYEQAVNKALAETQPDLLLKIKDIFTLELLESNETLTRNIVGRFDNIKEFMPTRTEIGDDLLAANDLLAEDIQQRDAKAWETKEKSLLDKMALVLKSTLYDFMNEVKQGVASRSAASRSTSTSSYAGPPTLQRALTLTGNTNYPIVPVSGGELVNTHPTGPKLIEGTSTELSSVTEHSIENATGKQAEVYQKLLDFVTELRKNRERPKNDDSKKADVWWRSFRSWMGDKFDSVSKFGKDHAGWLSTLGTLLATMILDPKLYKRIGQIISEYIPDAEALVKKGWDYLKAKSKSALDWVLDKLGFNKKPTGTDKDNMIPPGKNVSKKDSEALSVVAASSGATGGLGMLMPIADFSDDHKKAKNKQEASGHITKGSANTKSAPAAPSITSSSNSSVTQNVALNAANTTSNRSTIHARTSGGTVTSLGPTLSSPVTNNVSIAPGIAGTTESTLFTMPKQDPARPVVGTPQVGLSSFGYNPGMGDSLGIMNSHLFTGA